MNLIVCVDDDNGMLFNQRRQSQDHILRQRILKITNGKKLRMNHYSGKQFEKEDAFNIYPDDNFLSMALNDDFCFVENENVASFEDQFEKIIVYKWNRKYPFDLQFTINLSAWKLVSIYEFAGSSHDKITEEVYVR